MVLLDGAHNPHAAQELAAYIDHAVRPQPVRWVVALSLGKDAKGILKQLLRDKDLAEVLSTAWMERYCKHGIFLRNPLCSTSTYQLQMIYKTTRRNQDGFFSVNL